MKKFFAILLSAMLLLPCFAAAEMTEEELHAWALANGYVKTGVDAISSATISPTGEYGDILLAIERAWEDAQRSQPDGMKVDTNTVTDAGDGESNMG